MNFRRLFQRNAVPHDRTTQRIVNLVYQQNLALSYYFLAVVGILAVYGAYAELKRDAPVLLLLDLISAVICLIPMLLRHRSLLSMRLMHNTAVFLLALLEFETQFRDVALPYYDPRMYLANPIVVIMHAFFFAGRPLQFALFWLSLAALYWGRALLTPDFHLAWPALQAGAINMAAIFGFSQGANAWWFRLRTDRVRQELSIREKNRKLKELDRIKSRFFSNISHELRTPLTLIFGSLADLQARSEPASELTPAIQRMYQASHRLIKLVDDLLEIVRLDSGQARLELCRYDLRVQLQDIVSLFTPAATERKLQMRLPPELPDCSLEADPEKVETILSNILNNALKYSASGGIIEVSLLAEADTAVIRIADRGPGIPPTQRERVFQRFERLPTTSRQAGGLGIGLSLARELARLHGGELNVEGRAGGGSIFALSLPRLSPTRAPGETPPTETTAFAGARRELPIPPVLPASGHPALPDAGTLYGEHDRTQTEVLIVEDNADLLQLILETLQAEFIVSYARTLEHGLRLVRERRPALIVSDIMLDQADGHELLEAVRADPELASTPFLFLSALAHERERVRGLRAGADDYITKPFSPAELLTRVKNFLRRSAENRATVQAERESIFRDIHDHLGATLTDLTILTDHLRPGESLEDPTLQRLREHVREIHRGLRQRLLLVQEREMVAGDFLNGLRVSLLRRFGEAGRRVVFTLDAELGAQLEGRLNYQLRMQLYAIATEICTNNLKYGDGLCEWSMVLDQNELAQRIQSGSTYQPDTSGQGTSTLARRVTTLGGTVRQSISDGRWCLEFRVTLPARPDALHF